MHLDHYVCQAEEIFDRGPRFYSSVRGQEVAASALEVALHVMNRAEANDELASQSDFQPLLVEMRNRYPAPPLIFGLLETTFPANGGWPRHVRLLASAVIEQELLKDESRQEEDRVRQGLVSAR